jgi:hypothetical protein
MADRITPEMNLDAAIKLNRLCAEYLQRIAAAVGPERRRLLCHLVRQLYDSCAKQRISLVKCPRDVEAFNAEQRTYLSQFVMPILGEIPFADSEKNAIATMVEGLMRKWSMQAIERAQSLHAASDQTSGRVMSWGDLEIQFISEVEVDLIFGDKQRRQNYSELGFEDRRKHEPDKAWRTLRDLAECDGNIKAGTKTDRGWEALAKRIQEIRKRLQHRFSLGGDPIPYVRGTGYRARFRISCVASYEIQ